jgi:hypothetical protein
VYDVNNNQVVVLDRYLLHTNCLLLLLRSSFLPPLLSLPSLLVKRGKLHRNLNLLPKNLNLKR